MYHIPIIYSYRKLHMDSILALSEEDIKLRYITPSILQKGWAVEDITMETKVKLTDGKINLRGNLVARGKAKFADYMLYYNRATPIAIVEGKGICPNDGYSFCFQFQWPRLSRI